MNFDQLTDAAEKATTEGRLRAAQTLYKEGVSRFPEHALFLGYNLGALLQMYAGDGKGAREAYEKALAGRTLGAGFLRVSGLDEMEANICENSMLLSLSFEEYENWASRLERLQPQNPILRDQRPRVRELRERGHAWYSAMLVTAKSGYDADAAKDPGRYAASASILQLLLINRTQLRVPRDEYRFAVGSYAALAVQAWSACVQAMERAGREADFGECEFVVRQAMPVVEQFMAANPADDQVKAALDNMRGALAAGGRRGEDKGPVIIDRAVLRQVIQDLGSVDEGIASRAYETALRVQHLETRVDLLSYAARNCEWEGIAKKAFGDLLRDMSTSGEYTAEQEAGQLEEMVYYGTKIPSIRVSAIEHILGLIEDRKLDKDIEGSHKFLSFVLEKTKDKGSPTVLRAKRILKLE
jgi:hypothetical protein